MNKALFFDLDGTLWDAVDSLTLSYNQTFKNNNLAFKFTYDEVKSFMGLTPLETVHLVFKNLNDEDGLKLFNLLVNDEIYYLSKHPGKLYDKVEEILLILKEKYKLYIVSNAEKGYIENFINALNMNKYFDGYIQAGDTNLPKWKNILYLKEKEHIDDLIYIGDTLKDKIECSKANVKFIHAAYGFGKIDNDEYKINKFSDLPNLVDKLFNK